jgi:hypothetical protein
MRRAPVTLGTLVVLVGPTVLAFYAGGFFGAPRVVAGAAAWALVLLFAVAGPLPLPRSRAGWVAVAGLGGLAGWTAVSMAWAPMYGPAIDNVERLLVYLAVLLAATALLRDRRAARAAEPLLALGAFVVIGYGLAGRLLPGIVNLIPVKSFGAGGRLEQPITYWNAEGLLAAVGLILAVRIAGDGSRPTALRAAATAACAPLGMGVYLSYSRGAVAVALLGLLVLLAAAPSWSQLRAVVAGAAAATLAAACSTAFSGVASYTGTPAARERDGAIMLTILLVIMLGAACVSVVSARAELGRSLRVGKLSFAARLPAAAAAATVACISVLVIGGLTENAASAQSGESSPARLASLTSLRYEYWRVGFEAFRHEPARGVGSGGFRVAWREHRRVEAGAIQVHSLVLEMASELGLVGLALLGLLVGGVAAAGRRALQFRSPVAPAACAVCVAWLLHASIDWDWQLPAVSLPALILAAALLAASEETPLPEAPPELDYAERVAERAGAAAPVTVADR